MMDSIIEADIQKIRSKVEAEFFANKNVLVTGGAGFIGSWLSDVLISLGAQVTVVDNLSTGRIKNIEQLVSNEKFHLIENDVSVFRSKEKFDVIFHMAAHASPEEYMLHPIEDRKSVV